MTAHEIQPQAKKEVERQAEATAAGKHYVPYADIYETPDGLTLIMDMPGVTRDRVQVTLDQDRLTIEGHVDHDRYDGLEPLYTEYNVGHFTRTFSLSRSIDREGITADIQDGVLTLRLPVVEEAKPRRIEVASGVGA
jgi:HSP20 family molecular chaperone IbpA